ncbi:MAG: hypothetical protein EOO54_10490 [Haliea sp.]|nr:MAG: hypothetical protein EOO54_10490 [Haliea sp.]
MGRFLRALLALLAAVAAVSAVAADKPGAFGKNLLRSQELPADAVARFVRFNAAQAAKGVKPAGLMSGTEDWVGEALAMPSSGNPYTIVVRVSGTALSDGEVGTGWMGGWSAEGATSNKLMTGATRNGVKAGERVTLVGSTGPVSFKQDRTLAPALSFMNARNLQLDGVQMEVWAGVGKATLPELVFAWSPLLVGLVFLGLFLWFRRGS